MVRIRNPFNAKIRQHIQSRFNRRKVFIGLGITLAIFILANIAVALLFRQRMLPGSSVGLTGVGNKSYQAVGKLQLLPKELIFKAGSIQKTMSPDKLGISVDWPATQRQITARKPWLPIWGLVGHKQYNTVIRYDEQKMKEATAVLNKDFSEESTNWSIDKTGEEAKLVAGKEGRQLNQAKLITILRTGLASNTIEVPLTPVEPDITRAHLEPVVKELNTKRQIKLSYHYNGAQKSPSSQDILSWYDISGTTLSLNQGRVTSYLNGLGTGLGIRIQNINQLATSTAEALQNQTKLSATIIAAPKAVKRYSYCIRAKNVSDSELPAFAAKVQSTLNDPQGWSLDGQVSFSQATSGCNMIVWLSAAADLPSFGAICDSTWSCAVRPNVIINYDRWRYASDAWNANGGSLEGYRTMVINHEAGHWLGFGHRYCPGAGQSAPVMQQQSINLQGCSFNPWPTTAEKNSLKATLGL